MPPESRISDEIISCVLPIEENLFPELFASVLWEDVGKGRQGAVLTKVDETGGVPLVRTTTRYGNPAQPFTAVHERLAQQVQEYVQEHAAVSVGFNNALVECYTNAYRKMGGHSDQALDLADESFIALFSCYRNPEEGTRRKLIFASKASEAEEFEIPLAHNSVVAFSVEANRHLKHRIVLDASAPAADHLWLGVPFRPSKTSVRFHDGHAYLPRGERLTSADDEQSREFYQLRRRENHETDFVYPPLSYTVSESDLIPPTQA